MVNAAPWLLYPGKQTWYPPYRRLGEPQDQSKRVQKILTPGLDHRTVQHIASCNTDCAILAHKKNESTHKWHSTFKIWIRWKIWKSWQNIFHNNEIPYCIFWTVRYARKETHTYSIESKCHGQRLLYIQNTHRFYTVTCRENVLLLFQVKTEATIKGLQIVK